MIQTLVITSSCFAALLIVVGVALARSQLTVNDAWIERVRDVKHLTGSKTDKEVTKIVQAANAGVTTCFGRLLTAINKCMLKVTINPYVAIRGLRSDPQNLARIDAINLLRGEAINRYVPITLADPIKRVTPETRNGVDGLRRVHAGNRSEFYSIPDFHQTMDVPFVSTLTKEIFIRMEVVVTRSGDWITVRKHSVEIIEGTCDEPKCMRLSYGEGVDKIYCWGYSKNGKYTISVSAGAFSTSPIILDVAMRARLRTGTAVNAQGKVTKRPNSGYIGHAAKQDGTHISTKEVTVLAALIETNEACVYFEYLDGEDVVLDIVSDNSSEIAESEPDQDDHNPDASPTGDVKVDIFQTEVLNPLSTVCTGERGSQLTTGLNCNVTRTFVNANPADEPRVIASNMIPPFITGDMAVDNRTREAVEVTVQKRLNEIIQPKRELTSEEKRELDRNMEDFCNLFLREAKNKAVQADWNLTLAESKSRVKMKVDQSRKAFVPSDPKAFLKGEPNKPSKPSRIIIATSEDARVYTNTMRRGATEALEGTYFKKHLYGFGTAEHISREVSRVQDLARKLGLSKDMTDFKAMDGTVGARARYLERRFMKYIYAKEYHQAVDDILDSLVEEDPKPLQGVRLEMHDSRRSGEAFTSLFNTLINLYVQYLALKRKNFSTKQIKLRMGIAGGDDGLIVMSVTTQELDAAAADLGMTLTHEVVGPEEPGQFLALWFDPISGYAYPDPVRFSTKTMVNADGMNPRKLLRLRCEALTQRWASVPLVGEMAKKCLHLLEDVKITDGERRVYDERKGYIMTMLQGSQFQTVETTTEYNDVMHRYAKQLGISPLVLQEAINKIEQATCFEDFPHSFIPMYPLPEVSSLPSSFLFGDFEVPIAEEEVTHPSTTEPTSRGSKNSPNAQKNQKSHS